MSESAEMAAAIASVVGREPHGLFSRGGRKAPSKKRREAAHRLAQLARTTDASGDCIAALQTAVEDFPTDAEIRAALAEALAAGGRAADAIAEYEELLRSAGEDATLLRAVAAQYERAGRRDLAVQRLQRAVDAHMGAGELDAAVDAARGLIALEPASIERASDLIALLRSRDPALLADALEHLADVYRTREKLGLEADACRDLFALSPDRPGARVRLSALCERILEVDADDADAWRGIEAADPSTAQRLRERLRPTAPARVVQNVASGRAEEAHPAYAARKARELMLGGDVAAACVCLERAAQTVASADLLLELARGYEALHRCADAERAALRSIAVGRAADDGASVDLALGWLCDARPLLAVPIGDAVFLSGRPESADTLYEQLLQIWDEATGAAAASGLAE